MIMETRKVLLFKINNEVVLESDGDLHLDKIDELKWQLCLECEVSLFDIDVEMVEYPINTSDFDVSSLGMYNFKDPYFKHITGVKLPFELGSDSYLDALSDGSLIDLLELN